MLETAILTTAALALLGVMIWVAYIVGHMNGVAEARRRLAQDEGRK